jgi:nitroreductase
METITCIHARRSIRRFTNDPIQDEDVNIILSAAFSAPSAHNLHPCEYIVLRDRDNLVTLASKLTYGRSLNEAACAICVVGDTNRQDNWEFINQDAAAATQNMALAAVDCGLSSVWIGCTPSNENSHELSEVLNLPDYVKCLSILAIGYAAVTKEPNNRFEHLKIHKEKW